MKRFIAKLKRETFGASLVEKYKAAWILNAFQQGDMEKAQLLAQKMVDNQQSVGAYFLAYVYLLRGEYAKAQGHIDAYLQARPDHADGVYLASDIYYFKGDIEQAWQVLEALSQKTKRLKTWLYMCQLVQTENDFDRVQHHYQSSVKLGLAPKAHPTLTQYFINGALRARAYQRAIDLAFESLISDPVCKLKKTSSGFTIADASKALHDLKTALEKEHIEFFLVSGTLLGAVREKSILGHDKDIDVGVWDTTPKENVIVALQKSGLFYISKSRSEHTLRVRHINGIPIDIFYHYKQGDQVWHGGVKLNWFNKIFDLEIYRFLGQDYLIPSDYNQYLVENYGQDWRTPKKQFDSAIDTPNGQVVQPQEMLVHALMQLKHPQTNENVQRYIKVLCLHQLPVNQLNKVKEKFSLSNSNYIAEFEKQ